MLRLEYSEAAYQHIQTNMQPEAVRLLSRIVVCLVMMGSGRTMAQFYQSKLGLLPEHLSFFGIESITALLNELYQYCAVEQTKTGTGEAERVTGLHVEDESKRAFFNHELVKAFKAYVVFVFMYCGYSGESKAGVKQLTDMPYEMLTKIMQHVLPGLTKKYFKARQLGGELNNVNIEYAVRHILRYYLPAREHPLDMMIAIDELARQFRHVSQNNAAPESNASATQAGTARPDEHARDGIDNAGTANNPAVGN